MKPLKRLDFNEPHDKATQKREITVSHEYKIIGIDGPIENSFSNEKKKVHEVGNVYIK
jgi:hypothetical protein